MTEDEHDEELLLRRFRANAPGDSALRQLRRRYDLLREDYERLLDRLVELEERLAAPEPRISRPAGSAATVADGASVNAVTQQILAPLLDLRDSYVEMLTRLQEVVEGLDSVAAGMMKGQHAAPPAGPVPASPVPRPRTVDVETRGRGFGEMLDFQERLSALPGVSRVSIQAAGNDRATFIVELSPAE